MSDATEETKPAVPWWVAYKAAKASGTFRKYERSVVPVRYDRTDKSCGERGLEWILPWSLQDYPGFWRGSLQVLGERVTWGAVIKWRKRRRWPDWAVEAIRGAVWARLESGQRILADLDDELAKRRAVLERRAGYHEVREDGRDRRGNWRK
jgi:hypothetical protein